MLSLAQARANGHGVGQAWWHAGDNDAETLARCIVGLPDVAKR